MGARSGQRLHAADPGPRPQLRLGRKPISEDLYDAMREFVRLHPQWDQYRLMQVALAGFLFQHGCQDRAVARHYLDGLFRRQDPSGRLTEPHR